MEQAIVFRPGALGDTMVSLDAIAALKRLFPDAHVELVGNLGAARLLTAAGLVDRATSFDDVEVGGLFSAPPVIPVRWSGAAAVVLWLPHCNQLADAFRSAGTDFVVCAPPLAAPRGQHVSDYLLTTVDPAAALEEPVRIRLPRHPPASRRSAALHPGSGSLRKNWPPTRFAELARSLIAHGWGVSLIQGPADREAVSDVLALLENTVPVVSPATVEDLATVLASSGLYVGNDSGVSHLSARLGVPTVAIFGPTDPGTWAPRGRRAVAVSGQEPWPAVGNVLEAAVRVAGRAWPRPAGSLSRPSAAPIDNEGAREQRQHD